MLACTVRPHAGDTVATLQHESQNTFFHSQQDPNRFDRDRLFSVVSRGVPEELTGLLEYLRRTSKYLTDSAYTGSLWCPLSAVLGAGENAQWLRALTALPEAWVRFPAPTWKLTAICKSSFRRSDPFFLDFMGLCTL